MHGTFASPKPERRDWYSLGQGEPNFASKLDERLKELGVGEAVARTAQCVSVPVDWGGSNEHDARLDGASRLKACIDGIVEKDPTARIHIVAHSHGGNVALKAIELYLRDVARQGTDLGNRIELTMERGEIADFRRVVKRSAEDAKVSEARMAAAAPIIDRYVELYEDYARALGAPMSESLPPGPLRDLVRTANRMFRRNAAPKPRVLRRGPRISHELGRFWSTSPHTNRLGRVVFMGTPFYRKHWDPAQGRFGRWLGFAVNVPGFALLFALGIYIVIVFYWWFAWVLAGWSFGFELNWISKPQLDARDWATWVHYVLGGILLALGTGMAVEHATPRDVNFYFDEDSLDPPSDDLKAEESALPLQTMVVHAGVLDEVLMAMSASPIVHGVIFPRLRDLAARPRYSEPTATGDPGLSPARALRWLLRAVMIFFARILHFLLQKLYMRATEWMNHQVLKAVESAAYGLPAVDFEAATIAVSASPRVPKWLHEHEWEVGRMLLKDARLAVTAARETKADVVSDFDFIWDEAVFAARRGDSYLFKQVEPHLGHMWRRYRHVPGMTHDGLATQTARVALVLELRIRELIGSVGLSHSHYYTNDGVIDGIARFIANGAAPPKA